MTLDIPRLAERSCSALIASYHVEPGELVDWRKDFDLQTCAELITRILDLEKTVGWLNRELNMRALEAIKLRKVAESATDDEDLLASMHTEKWWRKRELAMRRVAMEVLKARPKKLIPAKLRKAAEEYYRLMREDDWG